MAKINNGATWSYDLLKKTISGGNGVDTINAALVVNSNGWVITSGNGADIVTGSAYNDIIWGDSLGNSGTTSDNGADTLSGGCGNDAIHGGNGADILAGDKGADQLWGDRGGDLFKYNFVADSNVTCGIDTINDFKASEGDKLDFRLLNPNGQITGIGHPDMVTWGGNAPRAYGVWADATHVYVDTDGCLTNGPEMTITCSPSAPMAQI